MSDTAAQKGVLNAIHAVMRWLLHTVLIPVVWVLELLQGWLEHLILMLQKV